MLISQTPLRISFAGGGTDLKAFYQDSEGFVVSTAIDKYVYVLIKERFDDKIYLNYAARKEIIDSIDEIQHELVREAAKIVGINRGFELATFADIPSEGSGLGSSSSLTVGLLNAMYNYMGKQVTNDQLAEEACAIEIDTLHKPIGKQDQYIAAHGGLSAITFHSNENVTTDRIDLSERDRHELGGRLMLFFTNITRQASSILTEQKEKTSERRSSLEGIYDLGRRIEKAFRAREFDEIGHVLHENWLLKKQLASGISTGEIDDMYEAAIRGGALGGKVAGAGGGGFLLLYVPPQHQASVRQELRGYRQMPFMLDAHGASVIFNQRRYQW
ncbi:MAG TPA: GHMP kinase [Candidatus Kapabacteria bacterium]|nr:GHMP kinase [Candidatus Kapabacteria bacterium]